MKGMQTAGAEKKEENEYQDQCRERKSEADHGVCLGGRNGDDAGVAGLRTGGAPVGEETMLDLQIRQTVKEKES